jgi:hypothetical protein
MFSRIQLIEHSLHVDLSLTQKYPPVAIACSSVALSQLRAFQFPLSGRSWPALCHPALCAIRSLVQSCNGPRKVDVHENLPRNPIYVLVGRTATEFKAKELGTEETSAQRRPRCPYRAAIAHTDYRLLNTIRATLQTDSRATFQVARESYSQTRNHIL